MSRLTEKYKDNYYPVLRNDDCLEKLGELEDIEEELGIDFVTLFKALSSTTFYTKFLYNEIKEAIIDIHFMRVGLFSKCLILLREEYYHSIILPLRDYGKTWALTREELDNEPNNNL